MADDLDRYWFVAAVFREPHDLVMTIRDLRAQKIANERLLIVANHKAEDARKALLGSDCGQVRVIASHSGGDLEGSATLPRELRTLLEAMDVSPVAAGGHDLETKSQVYEQLRCDVADGALVLIASVLSPDEQLDGARILLRGNCECVLTHEIAL